MKLLADATLPNLCELFPSPFQLTMYSTQNELQDKLLTHDVLLCRSTLTVNDKLLLGSSIQCVATASSGIDHIDTNYLNQQGIALFDAKGCNANAVADYVMATLAFLYQNKPIIGNKAGILGLGEVGSRVMARLHAIGFDVICYDPPRAEFDKQQTYCSLSELTSCDLICVHANLHQSPPYPSANLLTGDFLKKLKSGTTIINAARGGIINEKDLLEVNKKITYCTDVYLNEPTISADVVNFATLCTPHIAGHSIEAKIAAVVALSQQLHQHYGIPTPTIELFTKRTPIIGPKNKHFPLGWQDSVLSLYNPITDTQILKRAPDKSLAFLTQRQTHQNRHDFAFY